MSQLTALILTLSIESPLVCAAFFKREKLLVRLLSLSVVPTLITHPILWIASSNLPPLLPYYWCVAGLEIAVVISEGCLLAAISHYGLLYCLLVSLVANAASALVGPVLWRFFL